MYDLSQFHETQKACFALLDFIIINHSPYLTARVIQLKNTHQLHCVKSVKNVSSITNEGQVFVIKKYNLLYMC